ncbi:MAG: RNA 2',3'-cyclic phosphodiesterase, partial [Nanoarchaeota archaeon]
MKSKKRCFVSVEPPAHIKKEILKIQKVLPKFIGKSIELENLHLTLKFLSEIDEETILKVKKKLSEIKLNKIHCKINTLGVFSEKFVRIIWLKVQGVEELQKLIDEKLNEIGFEKENRFMSHLTIARVKIINNKKDFLKKLNKIDIPELEFNIKSFELKESILKPEG